MDYVEETELAILREKRYVEATVYANCFSMHEGRQLSEHERNVFFQAYDARIENETKTAEPNERKKKTLNQVIQVLEDFLIEDAASPKDLVLYWKKLGDYGWTMSELLSEPRDRSTAIQDAKHAYEAATRWLSETSKIPPHHPVRLELAISHADFCYHALEQRQERAIEIAKTAFDDHIAELGTPDEATSRANTRNLQRLKERLDAWLLDSPHRGKYTETTNGDGGLQEK